MARHTCGRRWAFLRSWPHTACCRLPQGRVGRPARLGCGFKLARGCHSFEAISLRPGRANLQPRWLAPRPASWATSQSASVPGWRGRRRRAAAAAALHHAAKMSSLASSGRMSAAAIPSCSTLSRWWGTSGGLGPGGGGTVGGAPVSHHAGRARPSDEGSGPSNMQAPTRAALQQKQNLHCRHTIKVRALAWVRHPA